MKRAENCENARISHISIQDDSIAFEFAKSKGHQDGEEALGPWHVFANPHEPSTCAFLAMARYVFSFPEVLRNNCPLFPGTDQYTRYCRIFAKVIEEHKVELKSLGVEPQDLGTHSTRKGVATQCTSGSTVSPPLISVCLRMGWTIIGTVQGRYLKYEKAGDQYLGRAAAGLDINNKEFAVSSYYFETSMTDGVGITDEQELAVKEKIDSYLKERLLSVGTLNGRTFHLIKGLFAAICYHYEYLESNVHANSPLIISPLYKDIPNEIRKLATVCYPWTRTKNAPTITGIPPHVVLLAKMEILQNSFHELKNSLLSGVKTMLDERNVGTPEYYHREVMKAFQELQDRMIQKIEECGQTSSSNTNRHISMEDVDMGTDIDDSMPFNLPDESEIPSDETDPSTNSGARTDSDTVTVDRSLLLEKLKRARTQAVIKKRVLRVGLNNGRLEVLPPGYQFPKMTSYELFNNWFIGHRVRNIPPFKYLKPQHLRQIKGGAGQMRKMKLFMKKVEGVASSIPTVVWPTRLSDINVGDITRLWDVVGSKVYEKYGKPGQARFSEMSWRTLYNQMVKMSASTNDNDDEDSNGLEEENTAEAVATAT
jgi:hypothetical protein